AATGRTRRRAHQPWRGGLGRSLLALRFLGRGSAAAVSRPYHQTARQGRDRNSVTPAHERLPRSVCSIGLPSILRTSRECNDGGIRSLTAPHHRVRRAATTACPVFVKGCFRVAGHPRELALTST